MRLSQLRYSRTRRKVDRDSLIRKLKHHLDTDEPIRDEALLVGGLLDAVFARYCASDRQLKRYEQTYLKLAKGLVQTVYDEIRTRARRILPPGLYDGDQGLLNSRLLIRYVIEQKMSWNLDETLPRKATYRWFKRVGLGRMLRFKFPGSRLSAIRAAYPEHFFDPRHPVKAHVWHPWDFSYQRMWQGRAGDELAKHAIRHLIEVHQGWNLDQTLSQKATVAWFRKVGLWAVLRKFRVSPICAIRAVYPEPFFDPKDPTKPHLWHDWDLKNRRRGWRGKTGEVLAKSAIRHLIEDHEGWKPDETLPEKARRPWFLKVGLGGMLYAWFRGNRAAALRFAYPHLFGPKGRWPLGALRRKIFT